MPELAYERSFRLSGARWRFAKEIRRSVLEATRVRLADGRARKEDYRSIVQSQDPPRTAPARASSSSTDSEGEPEGEVPSDLERTEHRRLAFLSP